MSILLRLLEAPKINSHLIMSTYHYEFGLEDEMVKNSNVDHVQPSAIGEKFGLRRVSQAHNVSIEMGCQCGFKVG
jgi:hypothetical protein